MPPGKCSNDHCHREREMDDFREFLGGKSPARGQEPCEGSMTCH